MCSEYPENSKNYFLKKFLSWLGQPSKRPCVKAQEEATAAIKTIDKIINEIFLIKICVKIEVHKNRGINALTFYFKGFNLLILN